MIRPAVDNNTILFSPKFICEKLKFETTGIRRTEHATILAFLQPASSRQSHRKACGPVPEMEARFMRLWCDHCVSV